MRACALALLASACVCGLVMTARAQVLGPGHERAVSALVIAGGPLADDTPILGVQIRERSIDVSVRDRGGVTHTVSLVPRDTGGGATRAQTPSFDLVAETGSEDVVASLAARVRARDDGRFWAREAAPQLDGGPRVNATALGWPDDARRFAGWSALLVLLGAMGVRAVRRLRRSDRARRHAFPIIVAVAGVFALALALRVWGTPWAPLHSNDHGIATVRGLVTPGAIGPDESTRYGVAYAQLVRPLAALCGGDGRVPFALAACAGALTAALLVVFARALFGSLAAGVVAGLGLALHPMHVRASGSETMLVLAALLGWLGLTGVVHALDAARSQDARVRAVWLAGLATAASLELGWTAPAFGLGVMLAALALARPASLRGLGRHVLAVVAWCALAAVLHARSLAGLSSSASSWNFARGDLPFDAVLGGRSGLFDPTLAAPALVPLALLGASVLSWRRRSRALVALALFGAVTLITAAFVAAARRDVIRYASGAHLAHFALAGAVVLLPRRRTHRTALAGCVALLFAATSFAGLRDTAQPDATAAQWAVARAAPPGLRTVRVAPYRLSDKVLSDYPEYLVSPTPRILFSNPTDLRGCRVWVGMPCWSFSDEDLTAHHGIEVGIGPMRRECVALLGGLDAARRALPALTPVEVRHREGELHRIPAAQPRIGYASCARE